MDTQTMISNLPAIYFGAIALGLAFRGIRMMIGAIANLI